MVIPSVRPFHNQYTRDRGPCLQLGGSARCRGYSTSLRRRFGEQSDERVVIVLAYASNSILRKRTQINWLIACEYLKNVRHNTATFWHKRGEGPGEFHSRFQYFLNTLFRRVNHRDTAITRKIQHRYIYIPFGIVLNRSVNFLTVFDPHVRPADTGHRIARLAALQGELQFNVRVSVVYREDIEPLRPSLHLSYDAVHGGRVVYGYRRR